MDLSECTDSQLIEELKRRQLNKVAESLDREKKKPYVFWRGVVESFHHKKGNKEEYDKKHTQRCLYLLNKSKRFNMSNLSEKYEYDEEFGKKMSWYERNKESENKY